MLKIFSLIAAFFFSLVVCNAQEVDQGSFEPLPCARAYVTVQFDFSKTLVSDVPLNIFLENDSDYKEDFEKDIKGTKEDFIKNFNDSRCPLYLTVAQNQELLLTAFVRNISTEGNRLECNYMFSSSSAPNDILLTSICRVKEGAVARF